MTETPVDQEEISSPRDSLLKKYGSHDVQLRVAPLMLKRVLNAGILSPEEMKLTPEGKLQGVRPESDTRFCTVTDFEFEEVSEKGSTRMIFYLSGAGGEIPESAPVFAFTGLPKEQIINNQQLIKDALIEELNPTFTRLEKFTLR